MAIAELEYTRRYRFRKYDTEQIGLAEEETLILDERYNLDVRTLRLFKGLRLTNRVQPVISIPVYYNPATKRLELAEGGTPVNANSYAYYDSAGYSTLPQSGWYRLTLDSLQRLRVIDEALNAKITPSTDYSGTKQVLPVQLYVVHVADGTLRPLRSWIIDANGNAFLISLIQTWNNNSSAGIGWYRTYASVAAANNTAGLVHSHIKHSRNRVSIWVRCSDACSINYYVSYDNASWRQLRDSAGNPITDSIPAGGGEMMRYLETAYPYIRIEVPTTGIDIEVEVVSSAP